MYISIHSYLRILLSYIRGPSSPLHAHNHHSFFSPYLQQCLHIPEKPALPSFLHSSSRNCINALPYSESLVTKIFSEGLLLLPIPFAPPCSSYGVTSSTLHMISIYSLTGFVLFLFQSLMLLCAIPVFLENSFYLIPPLIQQFENPL